MGLTLLSLLLQKNIPILKSSIETFLNNLTNENPELRKVCLGEINEEYFIENLVFNQIYWKDLLFSKTRTNFY